ncbi:cupin domain-containing protein [Limibacillus sp. MBR-115]|jgi:transcriptional regulator with XRE-family HTH domain|uniref:cupin domain-containing protein n=1 Tax=Limibacillus sp. MBR-115 TaxID=3156465 RepID=UPI003390BDA5
MDQRVKKQTKSSNILRAVDGFADGMEGSIRLGIKLKHARLVQNMRLVDLAKKVGCSESLLSKVENDKAQPSLQMLHRIAAVLGTSIGRLFTETSDTDRIVSRKGERLIIPASSASDRKRTNVELEWLVPYPESKLLSGSIHIVAPSGGSEGKITHEGEEVGFVLEGQLELTVDDETYLLEQGDSFCFASDRPHGYRNPGKVVTRVIWINTPATF